MKWHVRMVAVAALGIAAALFLAQLPDWSSEDGSPVSGGVRSKAASALTDANLVDRLGAVNLHSALARVHLRPSMLALELRAEQTPDSSEHIYDDLTALCRFSFEETDNIAHLLVRVVDEKRRLLVSMDASRERWPKVREELAPVPEGETLPASREAVFERHFFMVHTPAWQDFGEVEAFPPGSMR